MYSYLIRFFIAIVVVLGVGNSVFAASPLEKNLWRVELAEEGTQVPQFIDRVTFNDGKINSAIFERKKFLSSSYDSREKGDNLTVWAAKQQSDESGKIEWQGELQGDAMTGTLIWKQLDGKTLKYAITGSPVPKEEAAAESAASADSGSAPASASKGWFGCSLVR
ncbi:MAG: hypothetical protein V2A66_07375 [Pseudomonadota bacterium]